MRKYTKLIKRAKELGAKDAKIIPAMSIVAAEWVRLKCKFGCDGYGQSLTCPPNSPIPDETRRALGYYKYALLIRVTEPRTSATLFLPLKGRYFWMGTLRRSGWQPALQPLH